MISEEYEDFANWGKVMLDSVFKPHLFGTNKWEYERNEEFMEEGCKIWTGDGN